MLTVAICIVVLGILCALFWGDESAKGVIAFVLFWIILAFGLLFPLGYGAYVSSQPEVTYTYETREVGGRFYFFDEGQWKDVLDGQRAIQGDELSVTLRRVPFSPWYWSVPVYKITIPVVTSK